MYCLVYGGALRSTAFDLREDGLTDAVVSPLAMEGRGSISGSIPREEREEGYEREAWLALSFMYDDEKEVSLPVQD